MWGIIDWILIVWSSANKEVPRSSWLAPLHFTAVHLHCFLLKKKYLLLCFCCKNMSVNMKSSFLFYSNGCSVPNFLLLYLYFYFSENIEAILDLRSWLQRLSGLMCLIESVISRFWEKHARNNETDDLHERKSRVWKLSDVTGISSKHCHVGTF